MTTTPHPVDASRRHDRLSGLAGLLSVGFLLAAFMVLPADPGGSTPDAIARRYAEGAEGYLRAAQLEIASIALFVVLAAGLGHRLARQSADLAARVATLGGALLAICQLVGYGLIAVLALGAADEGDASTVMALYDASAVAFVVSFAGLALLGFATASALLSAPRRRVTLGVVSALTGAAGVVGANALSIDGPMSPHGDVGFLILLVQLVWSLGVAIHLVRSGGD